MTTKDIKKGAQINAGNFIVSIGSFDTRDVAIISKFSGDFVKLKQTKVSKTLKKVKRKFKIWINSDTAFTFQHMTDTAAVDLINILKAGK